MKPNALRSIAFTVVCVILGVLIALQMKNVNNDNMTENNLAELQNRLIEYAGKNEELAARNADLFNYNKLLEDDKASGDDQIKSIINEKERAAIFAGLREVKNYGIQILISCAEDIPVNDGVIRTFVNELRGIGAQAIAVNDERLVAMSEIRSTGTNIVINGNDIPITSKFTIKAIVNPKNEESILNYLKNLGQQIANNNELRSDQYDIQVIAVPELTIPALSEDSTAFKIDLLMPAGQK
jgi:uncharacterized protein YlxW (UPF0749 family)